MSVPAKMDDNQVKSAKDDHIDHDQEEEEKSPMTEDPIQSVFQNELILDLIMKFVIGDTRRSGGDISHHLHLHQSHQVQILRQVSKKWNESATRHFAKIRNPTFFGSNEVTNSKTTLVNVEFQRFLTTFQYIDCIPTQRYILKADLFTLHNQALMENFMINFAPFATEIKFCLDTNIGIDFYSTPSFKKIKLDKLKMLSLQFHIHKEEKSSTRYLLNVIKQLFCSTVSQKNVTEFRLQFSSDNYNTSSWHARQKNRLIWTIFKHLPSTIKVLRLTRVRLQKEHVIMMEEKNIKLHELEFDSHTALDQDEIYNFLQNHTTLLTSLKFTAYWSSINNPFVSLDIPVMKHLLYLELCGAIDISITSFCFSEKFPKLKTLNALKWQHTPTHFSLFSSSHSTLKARSSLQEMYFSVWFPQEQFILIAATSFPNISKLHIPFTSDFVQVLKAVFVHFPNATELYISDLPLTMKQVRSRVGLNLDCLFSGVSEKNYKRLARNQYCWNNDEMDITELQEKNQPSLLNMTKLRKLILDIRSYVERQTVTLTSFSVHFVFLKMEKLQMLQMDTNDFQISLKYRDLLKKKLQLKPLDPR